MALGQADDDRRDGIQESELPCRESRAFPRTHERDDHRHAVRKDRKIEGVADFFGKAGLHVIGAVVLALIETVGRDIAQPIQAGVDSAVAGLEKRVEQIRSLEIVVDENEPFLGRKGMKQAQRFFALVIGEDDRVIELREQFEGVDEGLWKPVVANGSAAFGKHRDPSRADRFGIVVALRPSDHGAGAPTALNMRYRIPNPIYACRYICLK